MADAWRRLPISEGGALPWLWLAYPVGVPLSLWFGGAPPQLAVFQLAALAVFVALYVVGFGRRGTAAVLFAAAIAAIGAVTTLHLPSAMSYFVFGATFLAFGLEARNAYRALALYAVLLGVYGMLLHLAPWLTGSAILFSLVIGVASVSTAQQKRTMVRLRQANDEIERLAKVAERERIARDLHDVLGHTLSLITLKSELASRLAEVDPARAAVEIRDVERIARASMTELRAALAGYHAAGIAEELAHARDVLATAGIDVQCDAADVRLTPSHEGVLALAIREAVTNVVRHAGARAVRLQLARVGDACRFEITDDGNGGSLRDGFGLTGMRERVESHGGTLERIVDHGTRLVVTLPLAGAER
jgi:two-component system, NarL family, sensor histidine kinase DesK